MKEKSNLDQKMLKEVLKYDPKTGIFTWLVNRGCQKRGNIAGNENEGYILIRIFGFLYRAHRLAFLYMNGEFPKLHIDHINRNGCDNRWKNLREVTQRKNTLNKKNNNKYPGAFYRKRTKKWEAQIRINTKSIFLGSYETPEEATEEYQKMYNFLERIVND